MSSRGSGGMHETTESPTRDAISALKDEVALLRNGITTLTSMVTDLQEQLQEKPALEGDRCRRCGFNIKTIAPCKIEGCPVKEWSGEGNKRYTGPMSSQYAIIDLTHRTTMPLYGKLHQICRIDDDIYVLTDDCNKDVGIQWLIENKVLVKVPGGIR